MQQLGLPAAKEFLRRRTIRRDLMEWGRYKGFEPAPHQKLICREIDEFLSSDDEVLLLFAPPGSAKSTCERREGEGTQSPIETLNRGLGSTRFAVLNNEARAFVSYFKDHSSAISDFLAPMVRSRRSVVARSASMPFSSWPIDLNPLSDRGSFSIARSFAFLRDSKNAFHIISYPLIRNVGPLVYIKFKSIGSRCRSIFGNESVGFAIRFRPVPPQRK